MSEKVVDDGQKRYKPGEFAKAASISYSTLRRWDKAGILVSGRTVTGRRYYTQEQLDAVLKGMV